MTLAFQSAVPLNIRRTIVRTCTRAAMTSRAEMPPLDKGAVLFVKADATGAAMGDCPFSQKANLALRFAGVDFSTHFVDLSAKPDWFSDLTEGGTTPVFVDGTVCIRDSDGIVEFADGKAPTGVKLEDEKHPRWDKAFDAVSPVLGALARFLRNKDEAEEAHLRAELEKAVVGVDEYLRSGPGPFLLGEKVCALDCNLAPKLQHVMVAANHYKGFVVAPELAALHTFMEKMRATEEWAASSCPDHVIIQGWSKFF